MRISTIFCKMIEMIPKMQRLFLTNGKQFYVLPFEQILQTCGLMPEWAFM